jgi:hypothetical protein
MRSLSCISYPLPLFYQTQLSGEKYFYTEFVEKLVDCLKTRQEKFFCADELCLHSCHNLGIFFAACFSYNNKTNWVEIYMGIVNKNLVTVFGVVLVFIFNFGCMNQARQGMGSNRFEGAGNLFQPGTESVLNGVVSGAGGSGPAGVITPADTSALQNVLQAPELNQQPGVDAAINEVLLAEMRRVLDDERNNRISYIEAQTKKWAIVPRIFSECVAKSAGLTPVPGDPTIGGWVKNSGDCEVSPFEVGSGNRQVHPVTGGMQGQLGAYLDGRIEIRSNTFNGSGSDSGLSGQSGIASLTGQRRINSKNGPTFVPCSATVQLDTPKNQMVEKHQRAMRIAGNCFQTGLVFLGMEQIFNNMDPALADVLLQQALK